MTGHVWAQPLFQWEQLEQRISLESFQLSSRGHFNLESAKATYPFSALVSLIMFSMLLSEVLICTVYVIVSPYSDTFDLSPPSWGVPPRRVHGAALFSEQAQVSKQVTKPEGKNRDAKCLFVSEQGFFEWPAHPDEGQKKQKAFSDDGPAENQRQSFSIKNQDL